MESGKRISLSVRQLVILLSGIIIATSILVSSLTRFQPSVHTPSTTPEATNTNSSGATETPLTSPDSNQFLVTKVIDGDTIEIEGGQRVRYIGIDTPETVDPRSSVQCFGKNASEKNRELVEGKMVTLEKDVSETDRYGRLLRYVYIEEVMVNETLVSEGYATASSYPPDVKYQELFSTRQEEARSNSRGLWKACDTPLPLSTNNPPQSVEGTTESVSASSTDCKIKGNITSEKIYHVPGGQFYDKTVIDESKGEKWFCTEAEAVNAGWRKSKV